VVFQNQRHILEVHYFNRFKGLPSPISIYNRKGGLYTLLLMVMVVTKGSLEVDVVIVKASLWGLPHPWRLVEWLDS
jgi:hypothetical protein